MNPIRAWNAFWFAPTSARPLGAFRIAFGAVALMNLAMITVDMDYWYTGAGLYQGTEARQLAGPLRFSPLQYFQDGTTVRAVFVAQAVFLTMFTIGWRTRTFAVLAYLGNLSLHHRNVSTTSGADVLLSCMSFLVMLAPCGAAYSLDARRAARRRGAEAEALIEPWAQRLMQFQFVVVYFMAAILKCHGTTWFDGTAMHFVLHNIEVRRFGLEPIQQMPLVINLMTTGALLFELSLPFLIWFRATRPWIMTVGIAFHVGVLFVVNIPIFGELMVAGYFLFLTPPELDAVLRAVDMRRLLGRRGLPSATTEDVRVDGPHRLRQPYFRFLEEDEATSEVAEGSMAR